MNKKVSVYTFRIYPNKHQKEIIEHTFKVCKEVYNLMLKERAYVYNKYIKYIERCLINKVEIDEERFFKHNPPKKVSLIKRLSNDYETLDDSTIYLEQIAVIEAYDRYFLGVGGFPRYKDKNSKEIYKAANINNNIRIKEDKIILPKLGYVKASIDGNITVQNHIKKAVIKSNKDGNYYVSLVIEEKKTCNCFW